MTGAVVLLNISVAKEEATAISMYCIIFLKNAYRLKIKETNIFFHQCNNTFSFHLLLIVKPKG